MFVVSMLSSDGPMPPEPACNTCRSMFKTSTAIAVRFDREDGGLVDI